MHKVSKILDIAMIIIGGVGLLLAMMLVVANTALRPFNETIKGVLEIVEIAVGPAVACSLVYTTLRRGHVVILLLFERFPKRLQTFIKAFTGLIGLLYWGFIAYSGYSVFLQRLGSRDVTIIHRISLMPMRGWWVFCLLLIVAILLTQFIIDLFGKKSDSSSESTA
jgi:TRAP-type C4-dicarboxylate transport system permease small subunit